MTSSTTVRAAATVRPQCPSDHGYRVHLKAGEDPCPGCREAHNATYNLWRLARDGRAPRELEPCGTDAAYRRHRRRDEVPCRPCTSAHATQTRRRLAARRGQACSHLVDAAPVREHVQRLRADGMGSRQIAQVAGVSRGVVNLLVWGAKHRRSGPSKRIRIDNAHALLAVRPRLANLGSRIDVDGVGSRRRLQALVVLGWTYVRLARELGQAQQRVQQLISQDRISAGNALAIRALYERLWDTPPPCRTASERDGARRARARAVAAGWAPPMAWDDDTIDDPAALPSHDLQAPAEEATYRGPRRQISFEDVEFLLSTGCNVAAIAARLHAKETTIERYVGVVQAGHAWRGRTAS